MSIRSTSERASAMPLTIAPVNRCVIMHSVMADQEMQTRLAAMGLYPGAELIVISRSLNGPCIVIVKDSRLVLGRQTAHKILVK
jgi:Fe2+ transport system protein FeoA